MTTFVVPSECLERKQRGLVCVFNGGIFGYCLCFEHFEVVHGQNEAVIEKYFQENPGRRQDCQKRGKVA